MKIVTVTGYNKSFMALADRVRELIDQHDGGNVSAAAKRARVNYSTLYAVATGQTDNPSFETLEKIARAYHVSVDSLVRGIESGSSGADTPDGATPYGGTAEEIIRVLSHPGLRDVIGNRLSPADLVQGAYSIALREKLSPSEMAKLDRWRDRILTTPANATSDADTREGA